MANGNGDRDGWNHRNNWLYVIHTGSFGPRVRLPAQPGSAQFGFTSPQVEQPIEGIAPTIGASMIGTGGRRSAFGDTIGIASGIGGGFTVSLDFSAFGMGMGMGIGIGV